MTNTNTTLNAHNDALQSLVENIRDNLTPTPEIPRYTLEEAKNILMGRENFYNLNSAVELVRKANCAWNEIQDDERALAIFNKFYDGCDLCGNEDFLDEIDVEDFIETCAFITRNSQNDNLFLPDELLGELIDEDELEEFFVNNAREFFRAIDWCDAINMEYVRQKYVEDGELDISEITEKFDIHQY